MLIGLLLAALLLLAVGIVLAGSGWLVASLVASGLAGLIMVRQRYAPGRRSGTQLSSPLSVGVPGSVAADLPAHASAPREPLSDVWVVDGRPRYHRPHCAIIDDEPAELIALTQAVADGFLACSLCTPDRDGSTA